MDTWAEGDSYEPYIGRWSRRVADVFLDWVSVAPGADWVDIGCGTGALTDTIARKASPRRVSGVDPSSAFIDTARARLGGEVDLQVGDARELPFPDSAFDAAVSALALNFIPDPLRAIAEMRRVTRDEGTVAIYVWDYAEGMEMIRRFWDVAVSLDPEIAHLDEAVRFPICRPGPLSDAFTTSGLTEVEVIAVDVETHFRDFDDYWEPFLGGQGPAPTYVAGLSEDDRLRLQHALRASLPMGENGDIRLGARAWAVKGRS